MISEDEAMELAWSLHPELRQVDFERAEWESGVNWHLHLTLDAIVLRRMSDATLPDERVVRTLQQRGAARRDAIHQIAAILAETIWHARARSGEARGDTPRAQRDTEGGALNDALNAKISALV